VNHNVNASRKQCYIFLGAFVRRRQSREPFWIAPSAGSVICAAQQEERNLRSWRRALNSRQAHGGGGLGNFHAGQSRFDRSKGYMRNRYRRMEDGAASF